MNAQVVDSHIYVCTNCNKEVEVKPKLVVVRAAATTQYDTNIILQAQARIQL